ncbi:hypothetical protein BQ8482_220161 [Mesorhizobium delmotii]|uniref:Uncharacterized protein n=1 Tax=Mesorhizobium delmotii TaxID=1631247 RepID=A0A2P9ALI8_9HYPH|nr:hypothetical protein BQ8482_220161 [Mesorhizobium delmotii]
MRQQGRGIKAKISLSARASFTPDIGGLLNMALARPSRLRVTPNRCCYTWWLDFNSDHAGDYLAKVLAKPHFV